MKIAVYGKIRSGKSSACEYIMDNYKDFKLLDFGDSLKECVKIAYPQSKNEPKNRDLLIGFGQHLRKFDPNIWVNSLYHQYKETNSKNILVTGIRQQNEYDLLKQEGFIFIEIKADEDTRISRCFKDNDIFKKENLNDNTETEMDNFYPDYIIHNVGNLKDLAIDLNNVIEDIIVTDEMRKFYESE